MAGGWLPNRRTPPGPCSRSPPGIGISRKSRPGSVRARSRPRKRARRRWRRLARRGLEELDHVAGGIQDQHLLPPGAFEDVVAEPRPDLAQPGDLRADVLDDQVDAVPAAGRGLFPI